MYVYCSSSGYYCIFNAINYNLSNYDHAYALYTYTYKLEFGIIMIYSCCGNKT